MASPTQRTLELFRDAGWQIDISEHFNYFSKQRKDLFGFMDLVAFHRERQGVVGIQATTTGNMTAREKKICGDIGDRAYDFVDSQNRIIVIGWKKYAKAIDRKWWRPTITHGGRPTVAVASMCLWGAPEQSSCNTCNLDMAPRNTY